MTNVEYLELKWSTSRGRETYGYNICTLRAEDGTKYRCLGGGYDMTGTVFADWLSANYQDRLLTIADQAHATVAPEGAWTTSDNRGLYGMTYYAAEHRVRLDGGCGLDSIRRIAEAIGVHVKSTLDKKGNYTGFIITTD